MAIPTGGLLPARRRRGRDGRAHHRADARARRAAARRRSRRRRAAARRGGRAGRRCSRPPAARCAPPTSGCWPRPGSPSSTRTTRPARRDRLDRRRGRAAGDRGRPRRARCATPARRRWPGSCARRAASRCCAGSSPTTPTQLERVLAEAVAQRRRRRRLRRLLGRGARPDGDGRRAARRGRLPRARDQARQADAAGRLRRRAADRAPGQPALGARRLPARRDPARAHRRGHHGAAACGDRARDAGARRARAPRGGSTSSRSTVRDGVATPRFGSSALLGPMVRRRRLLPRARGRRPGSARAPRSTSSSTAETPVPRSAPFLSDIPAAEALAAWLAAVPDARWRPWSSRWPTRSAA